MPKASQATELVSQREYARRRQVSHTAVQKAIRSGRLSRAIVTRGKRKLIDVAVADREWKLQTDPAQVREPEARAGAPRGEHVAAGQESLFEDDGVPTQVPPTRDGTYAQARAVREAFRAKMERIEFETMQGQRLPTEKVKAERYTTGRMVRDALLRLPDRLSAIFAGLSDEREIHDRMTKELETALRELVNDGLGRS